MEMVDRNRNRVVLLTFCLTALAGQPLQGQLLLRDNFDGSGTVNSRVWRLPFEGEGTFVGRTQYQQTTLPQQGIFESSAMDDRVTEIYLDTYSPIDPGNQFLGTDLLTKRNFARGGGLSFEARMRLAPSTPGGLVNGFFLFDTQRDVPPGSGDFVRDEIDWELISNQTVGTATQDPFSNFWNDGTFASAGDGRFHDVAGLNLTEFQTYRVDWTPQSIKWFVNNDLVRTQTTDVPDDPMKLHFNFWAPDTDFTAAFNSALQPTADPMLNQQFAVQVDHVEVNRFNTLASNNLLVNASFEDQFNITPITPTNGALQGTWLSFENAQIVEEDFLGTIPQVPDQALDGHFMASMFGPFNGQDASGLLQNVPAQAGQEFEARVSVQTLSADSILGNEIFNLISLSFLDATGNVIQEEFGAPGNLINKNGRDFPLLDGRDSTIPEDTWVEGIVNAVAPVGTAAARVTLVFVNPGNVGGATWYDAASLISLTPDQPPQLGDFDNNGLWNCADINALSAAIASGSTDLRFDMNGDGVIDGADITDAGDGWLAVGGANNPAQTGGNAFLNGDANLSGAVDGSDFGIWNTSKFSTNSAWCSGDFNASGAVDGSDFGIWNGNKFRSSDGVSAVPEPVLGWLGCSLVLWLIRRGR